MPTSDIYQNILIARAAGRKLFSVLIDPDKIAFNELGQVLDLAAQAGVDYILIGSSLLINDRLDAYIQRIKKKTAIPVVLFPGSRLQLSGQADGILLLSLISGRNPELLIGQHVVAAPYLKNSSLEIIPTGYMLIDGGVPTSVSYMSNTRPVPAGKTDIALCTAMAGEMLGLKMIYLDAGSGARQRVSQEMIREVSSVISIPLIVGGGIRTPQHARAAVVAGADLIVVGNAIEKEPQLLVEMVQSVKSFALNRIDASGNGQES